MEEVNNQVEQSKQENINDEYNPDITFNDPDYTKEEIQQNYKKLRKQIELKEIREKYKIISNVKLGYVFGFAFFICLISINICLYTFHAPTIFKIFSLIMSFPLVIGLIIFFIARFFFFGDFQVLKGNVIMAVSGNYIIANFFMTQKRLKKVVVLLNPDGKTFFYGEGLYVVDHSCIYLDRDNRPNSYYVPNIPNPLRFDFKKYLDLALEKFNSNDIENVDSDLDVIYSAENLKLFKTDKFLKEMHRDNKEDINKLVIALIVITVLFIVALTIVIIVLGSKQPVVNVGIPNNTIAR